MKLEIALELMGKKGLIRFSKPENRHHPLKISKPEKSRSFFEQHIFKMQIVIVSTPLVCSLEKKEFL